MFPLKSNITIAHPDDIPEQDVELWPKKTAADVIAAGDPVQWTAGEAGIVVMDGTAMVVEKFVGLAMEASDGATGPQFIRVAKRCTAKVLFDATGMSLPARSCRPTSGPGTPHNWTWTAMTTDAIAWSKEAAGASAYGDVIIDRDNLHATEVRNRILS